MASTGPSSKLQLLLFTLIGFAFGCGLVYLSTGHDDAGVASLQRTISSLQAQLVAKNVEIQTLRQSASRGEVSNAVFQNVSQSAIARSVDEPRNPREQVNDPPIAPADTPAAVDPVMTLKDLETVSDNDPRPFGDKLKDFLAGDVDSEKVAIASRGIVDMASDRDNLPDYALQSIYNRQVDPDLKRVIAQVLAQRGNSFLLDSQIAEAQAHLKSDQPQDRQAALNELAKTRSVKAVDAIAPYLLDPNTDVKLDALQALRDTGNQKHIGLLQTLVNDPDPAVSALATDVRAQLKNLSSSARTTISKSDIEATLPPLQN
jgi:hypothetical protein